MFVFLQDFIAQCIGLRYVGFGVAVWALGSAVSSFICGEIVKYVKRFFLFSFAIGLSVFLCLFLILFKTVESFYLVFFISFGFGVVDGMLKPVITCECLTCNVMCIVSFMN